MVNDVSAEEIEYYFFRDEGCKFHAEYCGKLSNKGTPRTWTHRMERNFVGL